VWSLESGFWAPIIVATQLVHVHVVLPGTGTGTNQGGSHKTLARHRGSMISITISRTGTK
jgi:hypothetical protein